MQGIREYLLSVTAAAIICAIAKHIVGEKGSGGKIIRVVTGIFLLITLISPIMRVRIESIEEYFNDIRFDADSIAANGSEMANDALGKIIKEQTEAYILDEATRLGAQMDVEVILSDTYPPEPRQVVIKGSASPYQKQNISQYISHYLGIPQENQIWK